MRNSQPSANSQITAVNSDITLSMTYEKFIERSSTRLSRNLTLKPLDRNRECHTNVIIEFARFGDPCVTYMAWLTCLAHVECSDDLLRGCVQFQINSSFSNATHRLCRRFELLTRGSINILILRFHCFKTSVGRR